MIRFLLVAIVWLSTALTLPAAEPETKAIPTPVPPAGSPQKLDVFPNAIHLRGPRSEQRIVVLGTWADGRRWDLTGLAKLQLSNTKIGNLTPEGVVRPLADGTTSLAISVAGATTSVAVKIEGMQMRSPVSFSTEIQPILTKASCNSGGCHGAALGRGGFRLSLFGFDSIFDYDQIVRSNEGRRVVVSDPERSILLAKPSLMMEHAGGEKLNKDSREYLRLKQWLEDGAPEPTINDPEVTKLEVYPPARLMIPGERQQLAVTALWSDGRREDVTPLVQYDALNDAVASVTPGGLIQAKVAGETHIMVRFGGQADIAQVSLPYAKLERFPNLPTNNFIDEKLIAKWKQLGLTPSELASDEEFLRRLSLDAIGTLPTPEEVRRFRTDQSADKRVRAIETVLNRAEFVDWWALKWGDLLRINRAALEEKGMWSFHNWVRAQLRDKKPVDEFVREILTAEGSTFTDGPSNFYKVGRNLEDWAENAAQIFLGVRVQCAKCHHHPFEKWSQEDYYGLAAFFARLGTKNSQEFGLFGRETVIYLKPTGEATHPRKRGVVKPKPFDGPVMEDEFDRRKKLADWATAPDNLLFARNIVNRFWGYLMGRGLVEPLDDMRATNPASNPELLDALAADFVKSKFDLKHLLKTIFSSRAYQLSSTVTDGNRVDTANTHFTRFTVKRISAEQLADAIDSATGTREKYTGVPLGTRAIQLPDTAYRSYLMDTFGRPARQLTCECERGTQPNIAQALHLLNGDFLNKKIADKDGRIDKLLAAKKKPEEILTELYLATVSRPPSANELAKLDGWLSGAPTPREGWQDLLWALLNSKEFLFNH